MKNNNEKDLQQKEKIQERVRKVDLSGLPRRIFCGRECIDWENSINMYFDFVYGNIKGQMKILSYNKNNSKVVIEYNNSTLELRTPDLNKGKIAKLLDIYKDYFLYNIGDVVHSSQGRSIEILECVRTIKNKDSGASKWYKYRCLKDGYVGEISEHDLKNGRGCPACMGKRVVVGSNDIETTHPELIKYLLHKEDGKKYVHTSEKRVNTKCPICGNISDIRVRYMVEYGFSCKVCGDGVSYPEKVVSNVLTQIGVKFEREKTFKWSGRKRYDFYLKKYNCIIEVHGKQHYCDNSFGRDFLAEQENDHIKEEVAILNGIENYIVIDASVSDVNYIKKSIMNSDMISLFELTNIDWDKCHKESSNNYAIKACELWNSGIKDLKKISCELNIAYQTVLKYIKNGREYGLIHDFYTEQETSEYYTKKVSELWNSGVKDLGIISKTLQLKRYKVLAYITKGDKKGICTYKKDLENRIFVYKDGNFIGSYGSAKEIATISEEVFGVKMRSTSISDVCNNKTEQYKEYVFVDMIKKSIKESV